MHYAIHPLTPERLPAFEDLFSTKGPACCWCMYWRIGGHYRKRSPEANKAAFIELVKNGPPPGLLAYDGELAVGWCQLTPRDALPWMDRTWRFRRVDGLPVWSLSCFYVRNDYRRRKVSTALLKAALEAAEDAGAPALEAYPLDPRLTRSDSHTGYLSTFKRAGFKIVSRSVPSRPVMRYDFSGSNDRRA